MMSKSLIVCVVLATLLAFCGRTECAESGNFLSDLSNVINPIETQIQNVLSMLQNVLNMLQNGLNILPPEIRTIAQNILNFFKEVLSGFQSQILGNILPNIQGAVNNVEKTFGPLLSNLIPGKK
ncbi:uncharacterized protein [Periplaneta americana]|uniref:uncharacterized protein isoform X1 n=1 Tax=Periplaneta americana TaxID=6978 RepID=UPI0037E74688